MSTLRGTEAGMGQERMDTHLPMKGTEGSMKSGKCGDCGCESGSCQCKECGGCGGAAKHNVEPRTSQMPATGLGAGMGMGMGMGTKEFVGTEHDVDEKLKPLLDQLKKLKQEFHEMKEKGGDKLHKKDVVYFQHQLNALENEHKHDGIWGGKLTGVPETSEIPKGQGYLNDMFEKLEECVHKCVVASEK